MQNNTIQPGSEQQPPPHLQLQPQQIDPNSVQHRERERQQRERWAQMAPLRKSKRLRTPFIEPPNKTPRTDSNPTASTPSATPAADCNQLPVPPQPGATLSNHVPTPRTTRSKDPSNLFNLPKSQSQTSNHSNSTSNPSIDASTSAKSIAYSRQPAKPETASASELVPTSASAKCAVGTSNAKHDVTRAPAPPRCVARDTKDKSSNKSIVTQEDRHEDDVQGKTKPSPTISKPLVSDAKDSSKFNTGSASSNAKSSKSATGAGKYEKVAAICDQERIMWTKIRGHPFWPTQVVRLDARLAGEKRFETAMKYRRKGEDTCVMYFGTCEVAWINEEKQAISWSEGLQKGLHRVLVGRSSYQKALKEVLAYCAKTTQYPRSWWCEPSCYALAHEFLDLVRPPPNQPQTLGRPGTALATASTRAECERVCWAKLRGHPWWPCQVLPLDVVATNYPELKLRVPPPGTNPSSWPCMFFGSGQVAMIQEKAIKPFITGVRQHFWAATDRFDFIVSLGEMWGYLQKPSVVPSGYLSGRLWWNHDSDDGSARVAENAPDLPPFQRIQRSVYPNGQRKLSPPPGAEPSVCQCKPSPNTDEQCCIDASCENVALRYLCDPLSCPAGAQCANVPFHLRAGPKLTPFYTADQRGWGLRLDTAVRKGDFVCAYIGEIIDKKGLEQRLARKQRRKDTEYYIMDTNRDWFVDAEHKGNVARFINSSCKPNCESQKWTEPISGLTHVGIFALHDIGSGTEITFNYHENFGFGFDGQQVGQFVCRCRADSCCMLDQLEREWVQRCVGSRIKVRWDDGWYLGEVQSYDAERKRFRVLYDDGDDEELTLGLPTLPKNGDGVAFKLLDKDDNEIKP